MDKYLKKFKATNYEHCIIKEELIVSDDEENDDVQVKVETADESFDEKFLVDDINLVDNGSNETSKDQVIRNGNGRLRDKNDKQLPLDSFFKANNDKINEQFKNPTNIFDEKPKVTVIAALSDNIDTLYKNFAKSHCGKCNVKRVVIRQKARCPRCKTRLTYSCETCNKTYLTFNDLGYHLKNHHTPQKNTADRPVHACPECIKTFAYRKGMLAHLRTQHGLADDRLKIHSCPVCSKTFTSQRGMQVHRKAQHVSTNESGTEESNLKQQKIYKCHECSFTAKYKSYLTNHLLEKHSNFRKKCENCDKIFTNPRSMKRHLKVYCNKEKRFECHHCGHKFYEKNEMLIHIDQTHFKGTLTGRPTGYLQMPRICEYCGVTLKRYEHMRHHLDRCGSAPKYCCDKCGFKTHFKSTLVEHFRAKRATCI